MNKVRIIGIAAIISGVFIGYFFNRTDFLIISGVLIGLGFGWLIKGKFIIDKKIRRSKLRSN